MMAIAGRRELLINETDKLKVSLSEFEGLFDKCLIYLIELRQEQSKN